jgi:hypothetical protein
VNLVCVLHKEHDLKDVAEFKRYWPGPMYIDSENSFYEALEKGEVRPFMSVHSLQNM